jgi:osmotically-inducible protein OsmY
MTGAAGTPESDNLYLSERIREALATDPTVGELGLKVRVERDTVFLGGTVTTNERRAAARAVAHELAPDAEVIDEFEVVSEANDQPERLA